MDQTKDKTTLKSMNPIEKLINKLCPDGVEFKEIWQITAWDKRFNGVEKYKQTKILSFKHISAKSLRNLKVENGDIKLLATGKFEGYTDKEATKKKILENVFEKGDRWFSSGDLLKKDKQGYYYFVDRIGDTFRWKSENVSTNEVSEAISAYKGIDEVNVYGVEVPNQDGRAGMASLVVNDEFKLEQLYEYLTEQLPAYSVPVFIRISPEIEKTGTFKYKKTDLVKDGYDPTKIKDPIYFASGDEKKYLNLDQDSFNKINSREIRV